MYYSIFHFISMFICLFCFISILIKVQLDQEKSKQGLADIYESQYMKQMYGVDARQDEINKEKVR